MESCLLDNTGDHRVPGNREFVACISKFEIRNDPVLVEYPGVIPDGMLNFFPPRQFAFGRIRSFR
jgi:hypothetical protein